MEQTKKGWFACLLSYARAGRQRLTGSVILSVIIVDKIEDIEPPLAVNADMKL